MQQKSVQELQYLYSHELPQKIESLNRERQNLCTQNYDIFVNSQQTLKQLRESLIQMQETVQNKATKELLSLKDQLNHINNETSREYTSIKVQNAVALQNVSEVVNILEIPQLVENCLRNNMFNEALDLDDCTRHMERHNSDLLLVTNVVRKETENIICDSLLRRSKSAKNDEDSVSLASAESSVHAHLLDKLSSRECRSVPMCLKLISIIRRLQLCRSERELRILFLQCRLQYVQKQLANVEREHTQRIVTNTALYPNLPTRAANKQTIQKIGNVYDYLCKLTDNLKLECFDMIVHYQAVFPSISKSGVTGLSTLETPSSPIQEQYATLSSFTNIEEHDDILPSCILHLALPYLHKLSQYLLAEYSNEPSETHNRPKETNQLSGEQVSKLLELCMYCGATLARVGADFRTLISEMFMKRVTLEWSYRMKSAIVRFKKAMKEYEFKSSISSPDRNPKENNNEEQQMDYTSLNAPRILLNYEPLAELMNEVLTAMNELRQCCPVHVIPKILESTREDLLEALCLFMIEMNQTSKLREMGSSTFRAICRCISREFMGHIIRCLERLFSRDVKAAVTPNNEIMNKFMDI